MRPPRILRRRGSPNIADRRIQPSAAKWYEGAASKLIRSDRSQTHDRLVAAGIVARNHSGRLSRSRGHAIGGDTTALAASCAPPEGFPDSLRRMLRWNWQCRITGIRYIDRLRIIGHDLIEQGWTSAAPVASTTTAALALAVLGLPRSDSQSIGAANRAESLMGNGRVEGLTALGKFTGSGGHDCKR